MTKKSILEEALLEAQTLEEAVKTNAKEILASTMKQEIEELVKESLNEQDEIDFELEDDEEEVDVDMEDDVQDEPDLENDFDIEDTDQEPLDLRNVSDAEVLKVFKLMGSEDGIIVTQDDDVVDIKDEETGAEYKVELGESLDDAFSNSMNEDDLDSGMEGLDDVEVEDEETMYEIELGEDEWNDDDSGMSQGLGEDQGYDDTEDESLGMRTGRESGKEQNYGARRGDSYGKWGTRSEGEVTEDQGYDDTEDESLGMRTGKESGKKVSYKGRRGDSYGKWGTRGDSNEVEANEASRTYGFGSKKGRGLRKSFTDNRNLTFKEGRTPSRNVKITESQKKYQKLVEYAKTQDKLVERLISDNKVVKTKVNEYKEALTDFRSKIKEVAVFNTNLAYATKLFTENTTSKEEKINIMRRFDEVETLNESKNLFRQLNSEFNRKTKSITESLKKKITKAPMKGSTNLIESKIYESPQISRIKDMMSKI